MIGKTEVAIVGAGPYGLSIASYLRAAGVSFRIFGVPMQTWRERMPDGMVLKSDGFASSLFDPASTFTLQRYCEMNGIPYDDTKIPVQLDTFRKYGMAFQQLMVPDLEERQVSWIDRLDDGSYRLRLDNAETACAQRVVLAVGISHFDFRPAVLAALPAEIGWHSSSCRNPESMRGRDVAIVGGGASAIDLAVLIAESGGHVTLVARGAALRFSDPPGSAPESLWHRLKNPNSPMGPGLKSRIMADAPGLFRLLPESTRLRIVRTHLGPTAGWPMTSRFAGRVETILGASVNRAEVKQGRARLDVTTPSGPKTVAADHVIAATGYRVDLRRLNFLSPAIAAQLNSVQQSPILSAHFESSVPGLYFVGVSAANTFGPMMRFACGAGWAAQRIARAVRQAARKTSVAKATPLTDAIAVDARGSAR